MGHDAAEVSSQDNIACVGPVIERCDSQHIPRAQQGSMLWLPYHRCEVPHEVLKAALTPFLVRHSEHLGVRRLSPQHVRAA